MSRASTVKKALVLLLIGTVLGWFVSIAPVDSLDEYEPEEIEVME